ncbi:putative peptidyl-tRNA hydrolase 2 [Brevipalpus obovatus]|uniref:putative peptidyl-tRNA hydrolase 2 n=1 Tax=Brevipalpus obovatus TaxID=246614 RepID=UPI003D9FAFAF
MSRQPERRPGNGDGQEAPRDSSNPDTLTHTGQTQSTTESSANTDYPYDPSDQFLQWNTIPGAVASIGDVPPGQREQQSSEYDPNLVPNPKFLAQMIEMGIPESSAIQALIHTKNYSAEMAISWVFEQSDSQPQSRFPDEPPQRQTSSSSRPVLDDDDDDPSATCKMVFVVNTDLGMKIGKTCAQVAHATLGLHQIMIQNERTLGDDMVRWLEYGQAKICLRADSTQHLLDLQKKANELNLPNYLVQDAGRTQIPAGSFTVLSIFGKISVVNQVTGTLRLL